VNTRHLLALTLILFCFLVPVASADDENVHPAPIYNRFGIIEGMWFPELTCELGAGWERLIFDWSAHQPNSADEFVGFLNIPDEWLLEGIACEREIIAVIKQTPAWATDGIVGAGVPRGLYLPIDDPNNLWANFMRQVGAYYASRGVSRFIIWNEPDIQAGTYGFEFEGSLEDYFMMVKVASIAVREGNPAARVHLAGTTYWHDINSGERLYTDRLLERIADDPEAHQYDYYFDAISLHIYFRTDTVYDIVKVYRDLLDRHGFADKAVWVVETNASPNLDPDWQVSRPQFQITLAQQSAFLVQSAIQSLAAGAERVAVYKLFDQWLPEGAESFGILNPASEQPRPAFQTWQFVIRHFGDVVSTELARNENVNVALATHANLRQSIIAWSRDDDDATLTITATANKAYLYDQYGNQEIIYPVDGVYTLNLSGASCEGGREGCVVGGDVWTLTQPVGDVTLIQEGQTLTLGEVITVAPLPSG
jgi:hypothetical protein